MPKRENHELSQLDGLKGYPQQMAPTLTCLLSVQDMSREDKWNALVDCLTAKLLRLTRTGRARLDNLISAQSLYTLRKLGLVEGHHNETRLTYTGWYLARNSNDSNRFKLSFAAILKMVDSGGFHLVEVTKRVRQYPGEAIAVYELALALARTGIDPCQSFRELPKAIQSQFADLGIDTGGQRSRLSDTLRFYNYADIFRRSGGTITLLDSTLERAEQAYSQMVRPGTKKEEFFSVLLEEYRALSKRLGTPYVQIIPRLREPICRRLAIDDRMFADFLIGVVPSFGGYTVLLSPPSGSKPGWQMIRRDNNRYYYLSIYPRSHRETSS